MIDLNAPGAVLFFGTMNAMPMMYARELRKLGQQVIYFVDVPPTNTLCRPECHYPDIEYPYPDWIVEFRLPTPTLASLFPRLVFALMLRKARIKNDVIQIKAVFVGGSFVAFAPHLPSSSLKIFLSYGSDLDTWCDVQAAPALAAGMQQRSIFKYLPTSIARRLIISIVKRNFVAAKQTRVVIYFPQAMNQVGDRIVKALEGAGVRYVPRYDVSFDHVRHIDSSFKLPGEKLVVFSIVRFLYKTFPEPNEGYSKGNDNIIKGLAEYRKVNDKLEIHFVEKGEDVENAKRLCDALGLSDVVVWHKEMPFRQLTKLLSFCDICFDQVGKHWIGGGVYAMYIGKPLIANAKNLSFLGPTPIMHAEDAQGVFDCLVALTDPDLRRAVGQRSRVFAEAKLGPGAVLEQLVSDYRLAMQRRVTIALPSQDSRQR